MPWQKLRTGIKITKTITGKADSRDGTAAFFYLSCFGLHEISPFMHFRCVHVYECVWKYLLRMKVGQISTALDLCVGAAAKSVPYTNRHLYIHVYEYN